MHTSVSDNDGYRSSRSRCRIVVVVAVTVAAKYDVLCNNTVPFVLLLLSFVMKLAACTEY